MLKYAVEVVYRPPNFWVTMFINIFENNLAIIKPQCEEVVCLGDFNVDVLKSDIWSDRITSAMIHILGLQQIVNCPTRTPSTVSLIGMITVKNYNDIKETVETIEVEDISCQDIDFVEV